MSFSPAVNYGGRYVPSIGTLRVLMVWIRFADDNEPSATWPEPQILPQWAANFVDAQFSPTGNYYPGAISGYFYENSYGKYHVIGDVYYVTTDYPESHYHEIAFASNDIEARSAIEMEVLEKLDRPPYKVNFTRYDNWTLDHNSGFNHAPEPDGILEMCWFMKRNLHDDNLPAGQAPFGIGWAVLDCPTHQRDGVTVKGRVFPSSGVGMFAPYLWIPLNSSTATAPSYPLVNVVAHEMGHYLFGECHFARQECDNWLPGAYGRRQVSTMSPYSGGWQGHYSGYEKWRLAWLTPVLIDYDTDNLTLHDQATTIDSTKVRLVKLPIPNTTQYFLIENRQWISAYEARKTLFGYVGQLKPGIIIYHIITEEDYLPITKVHKLDADGMFRWQLLYNGGDPSTPKDDIVDKVSSDPLAGFSETELLYFQGHPPHEFWQATYWYYPPNPYGGGPYLKPTNWYDPDHDVTDVHGDSLDLFLVGNVVTPWSNPGSHYWNSSLVAFGRTTLGIEIKQFDSSNQSYRIAIRVANPEQLAPSRPQDLRISLVQMPFGYASPRLTWERPTEPDVIFGGSILIYRRLKQLSPSWGPWLLHATVTGIDTEYVDTSIMTAGGGTDSVQYKVRSKDSTDQLSVFSDIVSMNLSSYIGKYQELTMEFLAGSPCIPAIPTPSTPQPPSATTCPKLATSRSSCTTC